MAKHLDLGKTAPLWLMSGWLDPITQTADSMMLVAHLASTDLAYNASRFSPHLHMRLKTGNGIGASPHGTQPT